MIENAVLVFEGEVEVKHDAKMTYMRLARFGRRHVTHTKDVMFLVPETREQNNSSLIEVTRINAP